MNLAPNGKPSNLTPEQYRLVRTPAFKKWFGDWENGVFTDKSKFFEYKHKTGTGRQNLLDLEYLFNEDDYELIEKARRIKEIHAPINDYFEFLFEEIIYKGISIDFNKVSQEIYDRYKPALEILDTFPQTKDIEIVKKAVSMFNPQEFNEWVEDRKSTRLNSSHRT